ncbi:MAG: low temperature requirement protein A [Myxococcales bacterium]|nr:low temperature requirement protein A [Myxococcales bacterium]
MQNRWFHRPRLHVPTVGRERRVGWLELFYDLIFVATLIQLGNALSHHVSLAGFLAFAGMFCPIWIVWTGFTFYNNRFVVDDFTHRLLVFLQMFGIGAMAISVGDVLDGHPRAFALSYAATRILLVLLYLRARLQVEQARALTQRWCVIFTIDALLWLVSAFLPPPWTYALWAAAVAISITGPLNRVSRELALRYPPDVLHMSERYGLLTLIVLGESFVKLLTELSERGATVESAFFCGFALICSCSLWWIYFDDVAGSRLKSKPGAPFIWVYTHLPMTLAITAAGVAVKKTLSFDIFGSAPDAYRFMLCGTLALAFAAVGTIDWVTERRQAELSDRTRINVRFASALFVLLLAPVGRFMPSVWFLALVAATCLAQVLFDMMMAPELADAEMAQKDAQLALAIPADLDQDDDADRGEATTRRYDISEAHRRGIPNELRRDLYFYLMEGSWWRLLLTLLVVYLFTNVVFAALYMLEPGSIAGARPNSFLDAFHFSVQTMSTIGYGVLSPRSTYANALVTIEVALGLLGVALATGVMFAKASRPRASVLFSKPIVITRYHGELTLMIRVGNGRGNEVVDASINLVALTDDVSPEGHSMRSMHALKLRRDRSPVFMLSWTVMHTIDESSPLFHTDWSNPAATIASLVATLQGHDGTYGQTVYARHAWYPESLRYGHSFVDIISELEGGRMLVDYTKFHDTRDEGWGNVSPSTPTS